MLGNHNSSTFLVYFYSIRPYSYEYCWFWAVFFAPFLPKDFYILSYAFGYHTLLICTLAGGYLKWLIVSFVIISDAGAGIIGRDLLLVPNYILVIKSLGSSVEYELQSF